MNKALGCTQGNIGNYIFPFMVEGSNLPWFFPRLKTFLRAKRALGWTSRTPLCDGESMVPGFGF